MRPLKLIMSGFESYCDRTEVDFEKLGSSGLYLIFGDTGAGKTTIFDAITFALYGTSSGENRKEDMLRSLMADDTIPTFVELTFETNGKIYKVTRNPAYERKSQRGGKQVKQDADATLEFITDKSRPPVTKKSVVTKEIEEILKLKKDQFCRIAMIAQGAFQKLLLSETKDKEEIFRDLFNTTKYQKLQLRLSEEIKKLTAENQTLKNNLQLYLDGISIPETNENFEALSKLRITLLVTEEDLKNLTLVVEKDNKASAEIKKEIGVYEKKLIEINTAIVAEENRKKIQDNICEEKKILENTNKDKLSAEDRLKNAEAQALNLDELIRNNTLLQESLKAYEEINHIEKEIEKLQLEISEAKNKNKNHNQKVEEKNKKSVDYKNELADLKDAGEKLIEFSNKLKELKEKKEALSQLQKDLIDFEKQQHSLKISQEKLMQVQEDFLLLDREAKELQKLFNMEKAGILAELLVENEPCPVCGSLNHPKPAKKSKAAPGEKDLEEANKKAADKNQELTECVSKAAAQKAKVNETAEKINQQLEKYVGNLSLDKEKIQDILEDKIKELDAEISKINEKIQIETTNKNRKQELEKEIPLIQEEILELNEKIKNNELEISGKEATVTEKSNETKKKKSELQFETYAEAKQEFDFGKEKIEQIQNELKAAKNYVEKLVNEISTAEGKIKALNEQLKDFKIADEEALIQQKSEYEAEKEKLEFEREEILSRNTKNISNLENIRNLLPDLETAKKKLEMVSGLSSVVSGNVQGQEKLSLETYIQMNYLDHINLRANQRLKKMTDGKYELKRRNEGTDNRKATALDLNVKDFYTGKERPVQTLSGGEQFQASLSLALGLADEIQNNAGGIKLDTMFIDEGFGTLDSDTLNNAMKALEDLSKGDKLIGIISHVDALQERIQHKVEVRKDNTGKSSLKII